jgi:streptogramin lyase
VTEFPIPTIDSGPLAITAGPDGNLWFTEFSANQIGRITTSGVFTEFHIPTPESGVQVITAGPDGNLWFTEAIAGKIGRITTSGVITEFSLPGGTTHNPVGIAAGPDGNLWFTETFASNRIGRITPLGVITEFPVSSAGCPETPEAGGLPDCRLAGITAGPDGNLWFVEHLGNDDRGDHRVPHPFIFFRAGLDHDRPRRQSLVHRKRNRQDRADHARRRHPGVRDPDR